MIARLVVLARSLTTLEWTVVGWGLGVPLVLALAPILGVLFGVVAIAVVALAYYLLGLILLAAVFIVRLRRHRNFVEEQRQTAPPVLPPFELEVSGVLADHAPAWADVESTYLDRRRVMRRAARLDPMTLLTAGLITRSDWVREPLAYRATRGQFDFGALERILTTEDTETSALLLADTDLDLLVLLGRMVAGQDHRPRDHEFLDALLRFVLEAIEGSDRLSLESMHWVTAQLVASSRSQEAIPLLARMNNSGIRARLAKADILNPFLEGRVNYSEALWLTSFNSMFEMYGLEPVFLKETGPTPFDRLTGAQVTGEVSAGPLISVIMSCFQPGYEIRAAVNSMISQSWQNWELLIADDASSSAYKEMLDELAELDSRIKILRFGENRGTYIRRNDALGMARGEFVTMQDSDDWAHPRRLELQARHLMDHSEIMANLSLSLRVTEDLAFVQPRGMKLRFAETSLMFRRREVTGRIGYYDSVRKAADSEYRLRLEAAFDQAIPVIDTVSPLSLIRYRPTSLSGGDVGDGWMSPERMAYVSAGRDWHRRIRDGQVKSFVDFPLTTRPFPAHELIQGVPSARRQLDVVMVIDGRSGIYSSEMAHRLLDEIDELVETGLSVGLLHMLMLAETTEPLTLDPTFQELINSGTVTHVLLGDDTEVGTIVVRCASTLQAPPAAPWRLSPRRVVVVEDTEQGGDIRGSTFVRADVLASATKIFGTQPDWIELEGTLDYGMVLAGGPWEREETQR